MTFLEKNSINDEMAEGSDLPPFLTNQLPLKEVSVMAKNHYTINRSKSNPANLDVKKGDKFSRLTIVEEVSPYVSPSGKSKSRRFKCLCDCGVETDVPLNSLTSGNTKSCGCLGRESRIKTQFKSGETWINGIGRSKRNWEVGPQIHGHPTYEVWNGMKARCTNKNKVNYHSYGGRGISVCDEWSTSPSAFIKWALSNGWEKGLYLDRIDVDGDYTPDNCRFVDSGLNSRNSRLLRESNKSGYRGVSFRKDKDKWISKINHNGTNYYLGLFNKREDAAVAYDNRAKMLNAGHPVNFG